MIGLAVTACGGGTRPSPTGAGSPSLAASGAVDSPGVSPLPTAGVIDTPFAPPWPAGWDTSFCVTFAELVVMQELAVDIGRALDEDDRDDARALTAELDESTTAARELLGEMPEWPTAEPVRADIEALLDLADEMALRYGRHLNQGRRPALAAAQEAGRQMRGVVDPLLDRVTLLAELGLRCPGLTLDLETPPDQ
ncbi:hypothetical protein BH23CHL7_BH23CHL7_14110 [soil metagenome]